MLPSRVRIREVGPRDGFQNEPEVIPTDDKVALIELLAASGLRRIELTSFVRADVVPQLADAAEVLHRVRLPEGVAGTCSSPTSAGSTPPWPTAAASARSTSSCRRRRPTTVATSTGR